MKTQNSLRRPIVFSMLIAVLGLFFVGCKSTPKVNWDSRIGTYTYDQAVAELGPPDKVAKLSDGQTVAEWIKHNRGGGFSFGLGTGYSSGSSAVGVGQSVHSGYRDQILRLVFDKENKLQSWVKVN
jgi:hypothetical protein